MEVPDSVVNLLQSNAFLKDLGKELHSHASISEKNCKSMESRKESIMGYMRNAFEHSANKDLFYKFLSAKMENVKSKYSDHERKMQVNSLSGTIQKKNKTVKNLEKELKDLEIKSETLKNKIEHEDREDQTSAELLHKAVKYFTTYFQYIMEEINSDEDNYTIKITFVIGGKLSKYPIHFMFDSKIDHLISFHAGALLTRQQHEIILKRFKQTNNFPALFSTLRHGALRKHVSLQK